MMNFPTDDNIPFTLHLDDMYDVSSKSADSLDVDEAFLDTFTADERLEVLLETQPVVLLSSRHLDDERVFRVATALEAAQPWLDCDQRRPFYDAV